MVDFNKKIFNTNKFRQAAIFFKEHGTYTLAPRGTTDYTQYWDRETERCINGYVAPDGDFITGYHYFYLNYSPIIKRKNTEYIDRNGDKRVRRERILDFPDFWDGDYYFFQAVEEAELQGKHLAVLKARKKGFSFKGSSMLVRNYALIKESKSFAIASEQKFLIGDGLLTKAWEIMDFVDQHTDWAKRRLTATRMERVAGFKIKDEFGRETEQGYKSSITGMTLKNDPERVRGIRGKLVLFEESGKFPNLETAWRVSQPSMEDDNGEAFGLMIAFGTGGTEGCLTAGNKIYTADGRRKNIEDLHLSDGIIGYDIQSQESCINFIEHINTPIEKDCVKISTNQYRDLSCSTDHPIYASNHYDCDKRRVWEWLDAGELKLGDLVAISQDIPTFGSETIFDPYLVGLLIGDGTYGGTAPAIFNADEEITSYVENNYDCVDARKSYITSDGRVFKALRIRKIITKLRELGIQGQTGVNKRLPEKIFSCTKKDCCELLAGLFDTDGCIRVGKSYGNRLPSTSALFTTVSLNLARDVRDLLQKIGVHAAIQKKSQRNRDRKIRDVSDYYNVEIIDRNSLLNLWENVKPRVAHKKAALDAIAEICKKKKRWYRNDFEYETVTSIEDIGKRIVYNLSAANTHTYVANGIITHNSSFDGLKTLFYSPEAYNVLAFPNIWDDKAEETKCGYFSPFYLNMEGFDDDGNRIFMDQDGNSLVEKAIEDTIAKRNEVKSGGASQTSIDRFISERPIKPQEAVLELGKNIFPRKLLMDQLTRIRTNTKLKNMKHIVDLVWDGKGGVEAHEKKSGDITTYHLKKDDKPEGSVVIWEYPIPDPPFGLYIGGCLTPCEKVWTQRGLINVEDVGLGDKLVSKDGKLVDIKNVQLRQKINEHVYRIKPACSYRTTNFTSEHPIWTANRGFINASELTTNDWLEIPNRYKTEDLEHYMWTKSNNQDKENKLAYFYGLFTGDGFTNINRNSYDVYMSIGKNEQDLANFYDDLVESLFDRKCVHVHKNRELTRRFTSKELVQTLDRSVGISAYTKRVPEWVMNGSYGVKLSFLQGFLDADGSVFYDKGKIRVNFTSVNLELLEDIQDLLFALEIKNTIVRHQKERTNKNGVHSIESYRINIAQEDNLKLATECVYDSRKIKLLRKSNTPSQSKMNIKFIGDSVWLKVDSINESLYTGVVYNFECETHTFMSRCIVTHNCDPYDHDESFTNSLGSTFIFKRVKAGEAWNDVIVAEYTGRPNTAEEYYENVRKLLIFYNARLLFENERKGIYPYFTNKHCDYLLADQPDKIITEVFKDSKVQRRKGCHMTKQIRAYGEGLILEWLMEEYEEGHPNLERIYSEPLIEELIENDGVRNVDRLIALCMVMIYREELYQVKVSAAKEENKQVELFELPLFSQRYWDAGDNDVKDDIPLFSF